MSNYKAPTQAPRTAAPTQAAAAPASARAGRSELRGMSYQQGQAAVSTGAPPLAGAGPNPLADLTPTQTRYIENLLAIEAANPKATPNDVAMAVSLLLWGGRIWEKDGKAADVTRPAGVPLVLDYAGGEGYKNVKVSNEQEQFLEKQRNVQDKHGRSSGVAHAFPAVAAQAGREGTASGAYNTYMTTTGGDFIQDMARIIVEQNMGGVFREAEQRDNNRAIQVAKETGKTQRPLSETLIAQFRRENAEKLRK